MSSVRLSYFPSYLLRQNISMYLEFIDSTRLADDEPWVLSGSVSSALGFQIHALFQLSHLPSPGMFLFFLKHHMNRHA